MGFDAGSPWFHANSREFHLYEIAADQYGQMGPHVLECAEQAGQSVVTAMEQFIVTHPETVDYDDVAQALRVWSDSDNVYVGIPAGDPDEDRMVEMETRFPVMESIIDLQRQNGNAQRVFERCLQEKVF